MLPCVSENLAAAGVDERANHSISPFWQHAAKPLQSSAAEQAREDRFRLVVQGVTYRKPLSAPFVDTPRSAA